MLREGPGQVYVADGRLLTNKRIVIVMAQMAKVIDRAIDKGKLSLVLSEAVKKSVDDAPKISFHGP